MEKKSRPRINIKGLEYLFKVCDETTKSNTSKRKGKGIRPYFWRQCLGFVLGKPEFYDFCAESFYKEGIKKTDDKE